MGLIFPFQPAYLIDFFFDLQTFQIIEFRFMRMKGDVHIVFIATERSSCLERNIPFSSSFSPSLLSLQQAHPLPAAPVGIQRYVRLCLPRPVILHLRWIRSLIWDPLASNEQRVRWEEREMCWWFLPSCTSSSTGPFTCDGYHSSKSSSLLLPEDKTKRFLCSASRSLRRKSYPACRHQMTDPVWMIREE